MTTCIVILVQLVKRIVTFLEPKVLLRPSKRPQVVPIMSEGNVVYMRHPSSCELLYNNVPARALGSYKWLLSFVLYPSAFYVFLVVCMLRGSPGSF